MSKRTLDSFFKSPSKKQKTEDLSEKGTRETIITKPSQAHTEDRPVQTTDTNSEELTYTSHSTYPFPIANLTTNLSQSIEDLVTMSSGKSINNQPHLNLLYFQPLINQPTADALFKHLRSTLPFYRVKYTITRFGKPVEINTPRFTTVFGIDETSRFVTKASTTSSLPSSSSSSSPLRKTTHVETEIVEALNRSVRSSSSKYKCTPRPLPPALSLLLNVTEALTGDTFNFCLVNYYATGDDSISYHSDDERFLGHNPSIASFTLGARRDFLMKHKSAEKGRPEVESTPLKLSLGSGDMVLMRGETQSNWLHSIPKRKGGEAEKGRINITLRKAMVPGGTENYYRYNVGDGEPYRWDDKAKQMKPVKYK